MVDTTSGDERVGRGRTDADGSTPTTRRRLLRATGALGVAGLGLGAASGTAAAASVTVPGDYSTVQAAVDAAASDGSITEVVVTEGTYAGTLTVDVPDLTVRTSDPKAATITGSDAPKRAAVELSADGVTFEGFVVENPGNLLGVQVSVGVDGVTLRDTHVTNVGPFTELGTTGIIADGGNDDLTITGNTVESVGSEFPDDDSGFPTTNGIFLNDDKGQTTYDGVSVADNVVRDLSAETGAIGILLQGELTDVDVTDNEVSDLSAANDRTPEEQEGTKFRTFAQGINVSAASTDDVVVSGNVVDDVTAEFFNGESVKIDGGADGLTIEFNDLLATVGIGNATATEVSATCNYWGHPKGPREVDGNREADDGPNRQDRSAYFGPATVEPWSVRSVENGENRENSCVGRDRGKGKGGGN